MLDLEDCFLTSSEPFFTVTYLLILFGISA